MLIQTYSVTTIYDVINTNLKIYNRNTMREITRGIQKNEDLKSKLMSVLSN